MPPYSDTTTLMKTEEIIQKHPQQKNELNREKYKFLFWEFQTPLIWSNIILISLFHIYTLYVLLTHDYLNKLGIAVYSFVVGFIGGFGVTAGAHRYFTHRTYKANLPLRIILLFCYSVAGQNSLKEWVRDHRVHHKFSETDADPHDARRGFFFSHVGWLMMRKRPEVLEKGKQVDCSDLFEDPLVVFHQRYFLALKIFCCFILPTIIPPLLWGESWLLSIQGVVFARYITVLNYTWLVNSAAHLWGNKPYNKDIGPVENLTVSLVSLGEGYHNYHHTFPWDYRAAEMGQLLSPTTLLLNVLQKIGWAYDMKSASSELIKKVAQSTGDGSHYKWGHEVPESEAKTR